MNKKQLVLAVLVILTLTSLSQAQTFYPALKNYSAAEKEQLDKTYASLLNAKDSKYVENALAIVTMIKLDLPADEFPLIQNKIEDMATNGATPIIQQKASLAKVVFANTAIFKEESAHRYVSTDAFFSAVAERANKASLSTK